MVLHAFGMSTSRMALRLIFLRFDFAPNVATSLKTIRNFVQTDAGSKILPDSGDPIFSRREDYEEMLSSCTSAERRDMTH